MADTLVLGANAHACGFKSRRLHQTQRHPIRGAFVFGKGGALRFLFRRIFLQEKFEVLAEATTQHGAVAILGLNRGSKSRLPH